MGSRRKIIIATTIRSETFEMTAKTLSEKEEKMYSDDIPM